MQKEILRENSSYKYPLKKKAIYKYNIIYYDQMDLKYLKTTAIHLINRI